MSDSLAIFVETGYTGKLLQGEMCRSSIDHTTQPIMNNMPIVVTAFDITGSCVYMQL